MPGTSMPSRNKKLFKRPFPSAMGHMPAEETTPTQKDISMIETLPHAATSDDSAIQHSSTQHSPPCSSSLVSSDPPSPQKSSPGALAAGVQGRTEEQHLSWQDISLLATAPGKAIRRITTRARPTYAAGSARKRARRARRRRLSKRTRLVLIVSLLAMLAPGVIFAIGVGANVYVMFNYAMRGVQHIQRVQAIFANVKSDPGELVDASRLHAAQAELVAAEGQFERLHGALVNDAFVNDVPFFDAQVASALALSQLGVDASRMGVKLNKMLLALAPSFSSSMAANTSKPLITPGMYATITATVASILPDLDDMRAQAQILSPGALPLSASQRALLGEVVQAVPQVQAIVTQLYTLRDGLGWLLGVGTRRTFLVETMDRAELRPTGGFTGQFGELITNGGRITPPALRNIGPIEENNPNSPVNGAPAPAAYRSWWPIPNWGLRDANLSADFPTSAQMIMQQYEFEFGQRLDGVMMFTPFAIEHILAITGPITMSAYHDTITAQNLEQRLHYYQLDNAGIRHEEVVSHISDPQEARKIFTQQLAGALISRVAHAAPGQLAEIARGMFYDMRTKDVEVYVSNAQLEQYLVQHGEAALVDRGTSSDGLYVVQANVSASKASQYVRTMIDDEVTLNASGGATHVMRLRLVYTQVGPVYGLDTYRDYVRVYVPPGSQFLWGDGFDTTIPLCGAGFGSCPRYDAYGNGDLLCPAGQFEPGAATTMLNDPNVGSNHPLDTVGPPTNFTSDVPGRAMFGGWVVIPKNCTMTVTLSWYVPPPGHGRYSLLVQRQSATFPELDLTVLPAPGACAALKMGGMHFEGVMSGLDLTFTLKPSDTTACYPQVPV